MIVSAPSHARKFALVVGGLAQDYNVTESIKEGLLGTPSSDDPPTPDAGASDDNKSMEDLFAGAPLTEVNPDALGDLAPGADQDVKQEVVELSDELTPAKKAKLDRAKLLSEKATAVMRAERELVNFANENLIRPTLPENDPCLRDRTKK